MRTSVSICQGSAAALDWILPDSVDLAVTSPPYPMVRMWDDSFSQQDPAISPALAADHGTDAFERMHLLLDRAWAELHRVLKPGAIACINIGDATRTLDGDFRLYSNHSRILTSLLDLGFAVLPDILWRKQTNAPTKFMGSGMLPVGAYVTYEHEYVLVVRKGYRRQFTTPADKARRRRSAYFWEERNVWFSDLWLDIKGAAQDGVEAAARQRSAAFPFELAARLVCMFSVEEDMVLDPFAGTGTTLAAALAAGRNSIGVDLDETFVPVARSLVRSMPQVANTHAALRLQRHLDFVAARTGDGKPLKHTNTPYGFPVMTSQERELLIRDVIDITGGDEGPLTVTYSDDPQPEFSKPVPADDTGAAAPTGVC